MMLAEITEAQRQVLLPALVWGGIYFLNALLAVAIGRYAQSKGHSFWVGAALCLSTSFAGAWLILTFIMPDRPVAQDPEFLLRVELEKARWKAEQNAAQAAARETTG